MRIADDLSGVESSTYGEAVEMRLAAMVEILLMAPIRRGNLARLDLERHLAWPVQADGEMRLSIPAAEVKNRVALEYFLPPPSTSLLRTYVERFRPLLIRTPTSALFPGEADGCMSPNSVGRIIRLGLQRHLGVAFNAHLFRHFACMNHLRLYPGDYETPRRLCGHKRLQTLVDHYAGMETEAAVRRFHEGTVLRIRQTVDGMRDDEL